MNFSWTEVLDIYEGDDNPFYSWKGMIINALAKGYFVSVFDGEEWQVSKSRSFKQIADAILSVDESRVAFWSEWKSFRKLNDESSGERHSVERNGKSYWHLGEAVITLWNDLHDSVSDTTDNEYMDIICENVNYDNPY